jgi:hypothetical protein
MAGPVAALRGAVFIPAESVGAGALRPGQVLQGTISGVPGSLELRLAGLRAALDFRYRSAPGKSYRSRWRPRRTASVSADGALAPELAAQLALLAHQLLPSGADDVERLVQEWATQSSRPFETRLLQVLESGTLGDLSAALGRDLRAMLLRLQDAGTFRRWVAQHGQLGSFDAALGRILERTLAGSMQNLRTFAAPYLFLDLPFPPDAPISRAQIHVFGEGGRGRHFDRRNASITLDLSTPRLGDLWISLTITGGACTCVVRAAREATVAAITAATRPSSDRRSPKPATLTPACK